ncbi:hypothetical protein [Paenarthrobacter sp. TA1.8]|uniref:hypothetical protein n=1 Tax=Paenarthrobacter sp. TA1.8 TaxID=3400219 RepID=UPI003B430843
MDAIAARERPTVVAPGADLPVEMGAQWTLSALRRHDAAQWHADTDGVDSLIHGPVVLEEPLREDMLLRPTPSDVVAEPGEGDWLDNPVGEWVARRDQVPIGLPRTVRIYGLFAI